MRIDPVLDEFASQHRLQIYSDVKELPGRSIEWGGSPKCLIQIYLAGEDGPTWHLWLCCFQDRNANRFWRREFAVEDLKVEDFADVLPKLLEEAFARLEEWRTNPHQLEFATRLSSGGP